MQVRVDGGTAMAQHTLPVLRQLRGRKLRRDLAVANFGLHFRAGSKGGPYLANLQALANYTRDHGV